jgi:glutathione-regulated potassium-efflux system ancillary protein KefG
MARIRVLVAHPDLDNASRVNRAMVERITDLPEVAIVRLYELYPDFQIDVPGEQAACVQSELVVLQHPLYWYSCPALLKEWLDRVLERHWAYGPGGTALRGKAMMSAVSCNAEAEAYLASGRNRHTIPDLLAPFRQTAFHCEMTYLPPFVFYGARSATAAGIAQHANRYRQLLARFGQPNAQPGLHEALLPGDRIDFS